jgi:hypothetical protein
MTAMPDSAQRTDALHAARSRLIDAFGEVEREIVSILLTSGAKILTAPLSQKIGAVRKVAPNPQYSKSRRDDVHMALDKLGDLLVRRAELAHSPMFFVRIIGDTEERAGFRNPSTQPAFGETMTLYRRQDLIDLTKEVRAIAKELAGQS